MTWTSKKWSRLCADSIVRSTVFVYLPNCQKNLVTASQPDLLFLLSFRSFLPFPFPLPLPPPPAFVSHCVKSVYHVKRFHLLPEKTEMHNKQPTLDERIAIGIYFLWHFIDTNVTILRWVICTIAYSNMAHEREWKKGRIGETIRVNVRQKSATIRCALPSRFVHSLRAILRNE